METTIDVFTAGAPEEIEAPPLTPRQLVWRRFRRHKMAVAGVIMLILLVLYTIVGAFVFPESYANYTDTGMRLQSPSATHPFGTDTIGRDILARTIYGGQISILIGLFAVVVEVIVGVLIGAIAVITGVG